MAVLRGSGGAADPLEIGQRIAQGLFGIRRAGRGGPGGERPASLMARVAAALAGAAPGGRLPAERE